MCICGEPMIDAPEGMVCRAVAPQEVIQNEIEMLQHSVHNARQTMLFALDAFGTVKEKVKSQQATIAERDDEIKSLKEVLDIGK